MRQVPAGGRNNLRLLASEGEAGVDGGKSLREERKCSPGQSVRNLWTAWGWGFAGVKGRRHPRAPDTYQRPYRKLLGLLQALVLKQWSKGFFFGETSVP